MSWAEGLVWVLVVVPPLLLLPGAWEAFRLPKLLASEWLALASLLALAVAGRRSRLSWRTALQAPVVQAVLPVVLIATAGLATTAHPLHVRSALADLWIGAACLVGWSLALAAPRLRRLLFGLLLPAALLAVLAILQAHDVWQPLAFAGIAGASRLAVTSTAGNPGDLAAYFVLPALLAQWQLARSGSEAWRRPATWLAAAALALVLYALVLTQTLAALAAVALGSLVLWTFLLPRRRRPLLFAAVLAAALLPLAFAPLRARVVVKVEQARAGDWNKVLTGRLDGWRAAAHMLAEHPLTGVGSGSYRPEFAPAKLALVERGRAFYSAPLQVVFANAHNDLLEAGAEWGIPGLLALAWALWSALSAARRGEARAGALAFAGLCGLAVLALAHFPLRIALTGYPALLFLAWLFAMADERRERGREVAAVPHRPFAPAVAWLLIAALVLALGAQSLRLRDRLLASLLLRQIEARTLAAAATGRIASTLMMQNLADLERAARLDPIEVAVPFVRGGQFLLMRQPEAAVEAYEQALALEPRPEVYLNLARARRMGGDTAGAGEDLRRAALLDPALASPGLGVPGVP
jgi:O-antigen ligase